MNSLFINKPVLKKQKTIVGKVLLNAGAICLALVASSCGQTPKEPTPEQMAAYFSKLRADYDQAKKYNKNKFRPTRKNAKKCTRDTLVGYWSLRQKGETTPAGEKTEWLLSDSGAIGCRGACTLTNIGSPQIYFESDVEVGEPPKPNAGIRIQFGNTEGKSTVVSLSCEVVGNKLFLGEPEKDKGWEFDKISPPEN